jgi:hypothetical protein
MSTPNSSSSKTDDVERADIAPERSMWFVPLVALAIESVLTVLLLAGIFPSLPALFLHGGVVTWLLLRVRRCYQLERDLRIPILLLASTAVMGPFGPAGVLLTQGIKPWYDRSAMAFEKWYATLFPEEASKFDARLYRQVQAGENNPDELSGLVPFIDILTFGTRKQKQAAVTLITNNFQPSFAPALRMALNLADSAIRVQAATAIARIENRFLELALDLKRRVDDRPESPGLVLSLARHYDAYAFAGILDEKRELDNRDVAVEHFKKYLKLKPDDPVARAELGRLLVRRGECAEAAAILEYSIKRGDTSLQVSLWYMESLYHLHRFADLRAFVEQNSGRVLERQELPTEVGETFKLWGGSSGSPSYETGGAR